MTKRKKTQLRCNAAMAKRRLSTGFWNRAHEKSSLENINNPDGPDEQFYRTIANILNAGNANPLSALLDHEYMATLDDTARQRYVLNMSQRINKSMERYHRCG